MADLIGLMDSGDAQTVYAVLYFSALPVALAALVAALVLRGRASRVTTALAIYASAVVFGNEALAYLTDAAERSWQPGWYVALTIGWGIAALVLLGWSLRFPPGRSADALPDRGRRLTAMFAGSGLTAAYCFAAPALYMLCVSPG
jgi:hypothetical protein